MSDEQLDALAAALREPLVVIRVVSQPREVKMPPEIANWWAEVNRRQKAELEAYCNLIRTKGQ